MKPHKRQQSIEHQQFITETVVPDMHHHHVKGIAEQGRGDADVGHQTVVGLSLREESEGKQSQQRTIGVTGQDIDGVNQ